MKMTRYLRYSVIGLMFFAVGLVSCNTAEQDVSPVISPEGYPVATITKSITTTDVTEGDTVYFYIKIDKWLDRSVTFTLHVTGGTADPESDVEFISEEGNAELAPYTDSTAIIFVITEDNFHENDETLEYKISVDQLSDRYLINPNSVLPSGTLTLKNHNDPGKLTIAFGWPSPDDDFDCYANTSAGVSWGLAASSANPEVMTDIWAADPDDTYYYGVDPYDVSTTVTEYTISIGYPNQTVEIIKGSFDLNNLSHLTRDYFSFYDTYFYRLLTIVKTGSSFTVTHNN